MLIGGGANRPPAALQQFSDWAEQKNILIIAWASEIPNETAEDVAASLRPYFAGNFEFALVPPTDQATQLEFSKQLARATGIFFTGGSQTRIMNVFNNAGGADLESLLKSIYKSGTVFGGTSAGTAIMSLQMITSGTGSDVQTSRGLGLLSDPQNQFIIDQHFTQRDRRTRLLQAMKNTNTVNGIGVDESTAILVQDRTKLKVAGTNNVKIYFQPVGSGFTEKILQAGDTYDMSNQ